jgi:dolichol-phosphate mannosyltransferase
VRTVVVVPTYNEAPNLERLVGEVRRALPDAHVLVVDDRSPDGTGEVADRLAAADARVRVLHRDPPKGRGLAGRDGYLAALGTDAEAVIEMDADFSHPPALLPRLVAELAGGADVVLASRFVPGGSDRDRGWARRAITVLANSYIRLVLGMAVGDCNSGYRGFRRAALEAVRPGTLVSKGPAIVQEVLFRAHRAGLRVVEVPLEFVDRRLGDSKLSLRLLLDGYLMVLRLRLSELRGRNR